MEPICTQQEIEELYMNGCNSLPPGQQLRGSYQIDGVKFMLEHELNSDGMDGVAGGAGSRGGIQADDMGMGKTNMAIFVVQVSVNLTSRFYKINLLIINNQMESNVNEEKIKKYADLFCKVLSLIEEKYMEKLRMNRLQATMNELKLKRIEHMYKHFGFARSAYQ